MDARGASERHARRYNLPNLYMLYLITNTTGIIISSMEDACNNSCFYSILTHLIG